MNTEFATLSAQLSLFTPIYDEFTSVCRGNQYAAKMLGMLHHWTGCTELTENEAQRGLRDGWIRKSAKDLLGELDFSRHHYQSARDFLLSLGVISYRRENKVHGMMSWKLNSLQLARLIAKVCGRRLPESDDMGQPDRDGFRLPDFIPLDLWSRHQKALFKKGKRCSLKDKEKFVKMLAELHNRGMNIVPVMKLAIDKAYFGFFPLPQARYPHGSQHDDGQAAAMAEWQRQQQKQLEQEKPPPTYIRNSDNANRQAIIELLNKKTKQTK